MNTAARTIILGIASVVAAAGLAIAGPAVGAQAATAAACNAYGAVLAGQGIECSVTVDNYDDGVDQYSTVTVLECHGAPFVTLLAPACATTVIINTDLTTSVTQCNGTLNGGGSSVVCRVTVNNHFAGAGIPVTVTYNQCVGSGAGGTSPVGTPLNCSPAGLTLGATVTQCNGSVNGGGGPLRVNCDVAGLAGSSQPVLVDQCNGTANGGGSVLFCSATFTDFFNEVGLPGAPVAASSTPVVPNVTSGTYGTPAGASLAAGRFIAAAPAAAAVPAAAGAAALLALSGSDSTVPALIGSALVVLGAAVLLIGRRRIRRPAHRMG
ncbi:MAG: hypothetical protein ABI566_01480 [Pseudolysinimonas sp.]